MTERFIGIDEVRQGPGTTTVVGTDEIVGANASIAVDALVGVEALVLRADARKERARIARVELVQGRAGERLIAVTFDRVLADDNLAGGSLRLDGPAFAAAVRRGAPVRVTRIEIAAAQAAQHGLPPIGLVVDVAGTVMSGAPFPEPGTFLRASGPPGGTLLFEVHATAEVEVDVPALERAIMTRFPQIRREPYRFVAVRKVMVGGAPRDTAVAVTGDGNFRVGWAAVLVPARSTALLVVGGVSIGPHAEPTAELIVDQPHLAPLFRSLTIDGVSAAAAHVASPPTLTAAKLGGAVGVVEPGFGPDDPRTFPPASVKVDGWPDALAKAASLPRALGALLGLAVGDALGTTNEFQSLDAPAFPELATGPIADIVGQGPFRLIAGQVTDDTQMATAIADMFWKVNMFTSGTLAVRYLAWRSVAFDVGVQIGQALDLITRQAPAERAGRLVWEERNRFPAGNGSLMRTAVIGALLAAMPEARRAAAVLDSAITHFDPRCQLACAAFDAAIAHALTARPSPASMLRAAREELGEAAALLKARHGDLVAEIDAAVAALAADLDAAREDDPGLYSDELHVHRSAGFVRVAFRLAFWELLHAPDFRAGVVDAANRGGDADTNAAIVGALLGAFHGVDGIPRPWIDRILAAPGFSAAEWEFHPRVFLRALAKGFAADRDERTVAMLAPYVAIGYPELAAGGAPGNVVSLATPAFPLRPANAIPLLRDLLEHAGRIAGFEHVTPDQVILKGDGRTLRVAEILPPRPRTPDDLARMPRALLCAAPELVAGYGTAPAVTATYAACALWLVGLRRHGPYAPGDGRPMLAPIQLPGTLPQPIADAVLAALRPDAMQRVPASFVTTMIDMNAR